ncbi:MAG: hypothetical protein KKD11_01100 [Candidatus Omnitrophica bacterium]|nr:hypothetical protein [Candidatus Omnitrophota bacterium]
MCKKLSKITAVLILATFVFTNASSAAINADTLRIPLGIKQRGPDLINKLSSDETNLKVVSEILNKKKIKHSDIELLFKLVQKDESVSALIALEVASMDSSKKYTIREEFKQWASDKNVDLYEVRLLKSSILNTEKGWGPFIESVSRDSIMAEKIFRSNKAIFYSGVTTEFKADNLKPVAPENKVDLTMLTDEARKLLLQHRTKEHKFTPEEIILWYGTLVGGQGNRFINSLDDEPNTIKDIEQQLGDMGKFARRFKAALPLGNTNMTILEAQIGDNKNIGQIITVMGSHENKDDSLEFIKAVTSRLESRSETKGAKIVSFTQPITPTRISREEEFRRFASVDKESVSGVDIEKMGEYCRKHAGEIAIDDDGNPIFATENHWDFTKFFLQTGLFLDLFEAAMVDGEIRDVILRTSNQDDVGAMLGRGRPCEIAKNILIDELQKKDGLYDLILEVDEMSMKKWQEYRKTKEFKARLSKIKAAVVEVGLMAGYGTGGGVFDVEEDTQIVEKANIVGDLPSIDATSSNAITKSLLADALAVGLRSVDIKNLIIERERDGHLSVAHTKELEVEVQKVETDVVPIRQQNKVIRKRPVQMVNRDIHGMLGRPHGLLEVVGYSEETYRKEMEKKDRALLKDDLDYNEHQRLEIAIARNLTFVPVKHLAQWRASRRPGLSIAKLLGYIERQPVYSPEAILARLPIKTPRKFLKALIAEGYYFSDKPNKNDDKYRKKYRMYRKDLKLAEAFIATKGPIFITTILKFKREIETNI